MASLHRKLLPIEPPEENSTITTTTTVQTCLYFCGTQENDTGTGFCPQACLAICPSICKYSLPVLLLPPDSSSQPNRPHAHNLSPLLVSMLIILASAFLLITFYALYTKFYHHHHHNNNNNPNPRTRPTSDLLDEEHGRTVVFHPIWYIPTVGLNPSVISSITVHQYGGKNKTELGAVHVEGSDCAVCLAEFQEGDQLRVLPKCRHAFHIPCIDTWLRSHTNCPLCRGPVVVCDPGQTAEKSSPSLGGVGAATEDHPSDHGDDVRIDIMRKSASMDGIIEGRGFSNLLTVSRSMSCSANIFYSANNNNSSYNRRGPSS